MLKNKVLVDLVKRNNELYKKGIEVDYINRNNDLRLREIVLEIKDNIERLIDTNTEGYRGYPKESIFNMIIENFTKKGMTSATIDKIYNIFCEPDLEKYKYNVNKRNSFFYSELAKKYAAEKLQTQAEKSIEDVKVNDAIVILEKNRESDRVKEYIKRQSYEIEKEEVRERREKQETEKIKIPLPEWIDREKGGAESYTLESLLFLINTVKDCAKRVFRYPPARDEDDRYYAEGITTLAKLFEPGTDLKFTKDILSYLDIGYEVDSQSIHSAKSKSKVVTKPNHKLRGMTREQVPIIREKFWLLAHDIVYKLPGVFHFQEYLRNDQKPYTAEGHVNRHEKLSESAFGNGSLCNNITITNVDDK